jgi:hypothetical protein
MLTLVMMVWSTPAIVDGDGEEFAITGEVLRKGSMKFAGLRKIQHDSFLPHALRRQALLLDLTASSGVASIVGFVLDAGKQSRKKSRAREMLRGNGWLDGIKGCSAVLSSYL